MLSYQHAYHAGNPADLHKHMALAELLGMMTQKTRGISYAETHAGRGLYDLASPEALKTGEAAGGVARIVVDPATPYGRALGLARDLRGQAAYPGSPLIARLLLRPQDRLTLMELHPGEHVALRAALAGDGVAIHRRDGYAGLLGLAPLLPRKGLVLVDPSYEVKSEYETAAEFTRHLVLRWPQASVMIWYPVLAAERHADLIGGLAPLPHLRHEVVFCEAPARGMTGSGLLLVNAPHGAGRIFERVLAQGAGVFAGPTRVGT